MRNVDIGIFCIAQTQVNREAVQNWLYYLGANEFEMPAEHAATDPALLVALAAKRCYMSFQKGLNENVTRVRKDLTEYLDNVLKSGHGSVLEHATYTFAIEGVSRVFTGEMNRHRAGVGISEGSMRYIRYDNIPWWMPTSIKLTPEEHAAYEEAMALLNGIWWDAAEKLASWPEEKRRLAYMGNKKNRTQALFNLSFGQDEANQATFRDIWKEELAPDSKFHGKKQITSLGRRMIPMGVATGGVWTMNLRAVRHILALRASEAAEEEIAHVFSRIAKFIVAREPMLLGDFKEIEGGFWVPAYKKV